MFRKWAIGLLCVGCLLVVAVLGLYHPKKLDHTDSFNKANVAYKNGNYATAIGYYQKIYNSGMASPSVYFNLGNAFIKDNQLGKAIVMYERALRQQPRDSDLKANLSYARALIKTPEPEGANSRIFVHLRSVTLDEIVIVLVACLFGISALVLVGLFLKWRFQKTAVLISLIALVLVFHLYAFFAKIDDLRNCAIMLSTIEAKYEPEENATNHFTAYEGWKVRVLKESSGWMKVQRPDGLVGWVPHHTLERID